MIATIVTAATGERHLKGQARLVASIKRKEWPVHVAAFQGFPLAGFDESNPYNIKASAMRASITKGRVLIWMDSSCVAVRPIEPLVSRILERGYYLSTSGFDASQTCTDAQLAAAGITRDQSEGIPDTATGCIGIDTNDRRAMDFLREWIEWSARGLFAGSRGYDPADSSDPRFLFARQDQSAATLLASKHGMDLDPMGDLTCYWPPSDTAVMAYKGI